MPKKPYQLSQEKLADSFLRVANAMLENGQHPATIVGALEVVKLEVFRLLVAMMEADKRNKPKPVKVKINLPKNLGDN